MKGALRSRVYVMWGCSRYMGGLEGCVGLLEGCCCDLNVSVRGLDYCMGLGHLDSLLYLTCIGYNRLRLEIECIGIMWHIERMGIAVNLIRLIQINNINIFSSSRLLSGSHSSRW